MLVNCFRCFKCWSTVSGVSNVGQLFQVFQMLVNCFNWNPEIWHPWAKLTSDSHTPQSNWAKELFWQEPGPNSQDGAAESYPFSSLMRRFGYCCKAIFVAQLTKKHLTNRIGVTTQQHRFFLNNWHKFNLRTHNNLQPRHCVNFRRSIAICKARFTIISHSFGENPWWPAMRLWQVCLGYFLMEAACCHHRIGNKPV